jgi:quinol monooxygenase YgiN
MVPRKRPPASRRRQVAIKVARGLSVASRRRKACISFSVKSQSRRNSTVRVWRSARSSCFHMERDRSAATTAQILSLPIITGHSLALDPAVHLLGSRD